MINAQKAGAYSTSTFFSTPLTIRLATTSGCVTKDRHGKEMAGIDGMRALGVKMLTDDGDTTGDPAILLRAMQYATEFGMFFASHCEVPLSLAAR